jgi:hypothetical protein
MDASISQEDITEVMAAVHACRVREEALACELASQPRLQRSTSGDAVGLDTIHDDSDHQPERSVNEAKTRPLQGRINNHPAMSGKVRGNQHEGDKPGADRSRSSDSVLGADAADATGGTDGARIDSMAGKKGRKRFGAADVGHTDGPRANSTVGSQRTQAAADVKRPGQTRTPGLTSAGVSQKMVAERRAAVFGSDDTSTFEELGLSKVRHWLLRSVVVWRYAHSS